MPFFYFMTMMGVQTHHNLPLSHTVNVSTRHIIVLEGLALSRRDCGR
jgi:hypothetical protein